MFELQLPVKVRRHFLQSGPYVYPGYDEHFDNAMQEYYLPYWSPVGPGSSEAGHVKGEDAEVLGTNWLTSELRERVAKQLSEHNDRLSKRFAFLQKIQD